MKLPQLNPDNNSQPELPYNHDDFEIKDESTVDDIEMQRRKFENDIYSSEDGDGELKAEENIG